MKRATLGMYAAPAIAAGLQERPNIPGERLRNDPPKPKKRRLTEADQDRMAAAVIKRMQRRCRRNGSSS